MNANSFDLRVIRSGQYPTFSATTSWFSTNTPFVISTHFRFHAIFPNMGIPLLFWRQQVELNNDYALWAGRRCANQKLPEYFQIAKLANGLIDSLDAINLQLKMRRCLCVGMSGLHRKWVFEATCIANYKHFPTIEHSITEFWRNVMQLDPKIVE